MEFAAVDVFISVVLLDTDYVNDFKYVCEWRVEKINFFFHKYMSTDALYFIPRICSQGY